MGFPGLSEGGVPGRTAHRYDERLAPESTVAVARLSTGKMWIRSSVALTDALTDAWAGAVDDRGQVACIASPNKSIAELEVGSSTVGADPKPISSPDARRRPDDQARPCFARFLHGQQRRNRSAF
jgi:hypothetical protein